MSIVPRLFGNCPFLHVILDPSSSPTDSSPNANPLQVDWKETPEAHVFIVDLPGLKKEDMKVAIDDERVLQICGERNIESDNKSEKWYRVERGRGKFCRRFRLPENAKVDEVKATMEDGVLTVWIPKQEQKKSEVKVIEIEG